MDKKVQEFLDYAREEGISLQELLTGIVKTDDSYAFMTIEKEIELGKENGADADFVYDKLLSIVSGEQMYTYIRIQEIVNEITSDEGLEICLDFDWDALEILKANRDAIKQELKNRGVKSVGYVENNISGVVTVQAATYAMEMTAWSDMYGEKESQFYDYFYNSILSNLEDTIFIEFTEEIVVDVEQTANEALTYKDIYRVLNSEDTTGFSKHDFDIYFAYKAVTGDVIYYDDDIAVEVMRVYDYLYREYEKLLEAFEHINSDCYSYNFSLSEYSSVEELAYKKAEGKMEDWFCYNCDCGWETIDL